jgi:hypothetical protein
VGVSYLKETTVKKFAVILFAAMSLSAFAADTAVKGYLVDLACGTANASKPGFGAKHTKSCLQMPDCAKSGYGVLTADQKVIKFDPAGNKKATDFIAASNKDNDFKVAVTGAVTGDKMSVNNIEAQ